jgi:hypothetical protein
MFLWSLVTNSQSSRPSVGTSQAEGKFHQKLHVGDSLGKLTRERISRKDNDVWALLTIAEVYNYRNDREKVREHEEKSQKLLDKKRGSW